MSARKKGCKGRKEKREGQRVGEGGRKGERTQRPRARVDGVLVNEARVAVAP